MSTEVSVLQYLKISHFKLKNDLRSTNVNLLHSTQSISTFVYLRLLFFELRSTLGDERSMIIRQSHVVSLNQRIRGTRFVKKGKKEILKE